MYKPLIAWIGIPLAALLMAATASPQNIPLRADLIGGNVVPAAATTATGLGVFFYDPASGNMNYLVTVQNMTGTAAEIRIGGTGANGALLASLNPGPKIWTGAINVPGGNQTALLHEGLYVLVKSAAFPNGQLRDQLRIQTKFYAYLDNLGVVPPTNSNAKAQGSFTLNQPGGTLSYSVPFQVVVPTLAHIHAGAAGVNGGIVFPLAQNTASSFGGLTAALTNAQILSLLRTQNYVDIHSAAFPGGEIRDQVRPSPFTQLAPQAANWHSTLITTDGKAVRDDEFDDWIKDLLLPGGTNDVRDAKFLFQECYGGGMLDDLESALGTKVKWVGGSASRHDQPASGQVSTAENNLLAKKYGAPWIADPPFSVWTKALLPQLAIDQMLLVAIQTAITNSLAKKYDHGQYLAPNGGETIKLSDAGATSHHAVLWAGKADSERFFNNIQGMRDALIAQWGQPGANVSITILFNDGIHKKGAQGDLLPGAWGAQAATRANLQAVLQNLGPAITTSEQFLFYASDHGGQQVDLKPAPAVLPPGGNEVHVAGLTPTQLRGVFPFLDSQPSTTVALSAGGSVLVTFNGNILGTAGVGITELPTPITWVKADNLIRLESLGPFSATVDQVTFSLGSITDDPPASFYADGLLVSVASGGTQRLYLDAEETHAGLLYLVLGTTSGTSPGIQVGTDVVPLNFDIYTSHTLVNPNSPPLSQSLGFLDSDGLAEAVFTLPPGTSLPVGLTAHHAYVVFDLATGILRLISNEVALFAGP